MTGTQSAAQAFDPLADAREHDSAQLHARRSASCVPGALPPELRACRQYGSRTVGLVDSTESWDSLAPWWSSLVRKTPDATVFQSYDYVRAWWSHLGHAGRVWIVVVLEGDVPVAIAPLQLAKTRWLGREMRCLTFLGQASEIDRPTILGADGRPDLQQALVDYILGKSADWDCLVLHEQRPQSPFLGLLISGLRERGFLTTLAPGAECARVDITGSWTAFLATRPRAFRKSLRRKEAALAARGNVRLECTDSTDPGALQRYLEVERASWKPAAGLGVGKSARHLAFYDSITKAGAGDFEPQFRFLQVGERTVAASFGLLWRGTFYSLHIAHDSAYSDYSPGVVLTAQELERSFASKECGVYDFLGGFLTNKRGWATAMDSTVTLYADYPTARGRLFHWTYFEAKPALRRGLERAGLLESLLRARKRIARHVRGLDTWT